MTPEQVRDVLQKKPFEPFQIVQTDGTGYEIRHPDLVFLGQRALMVGLTGDPAQTLFERTITLDLLHVIRLEPLAGHASQGNGQA